VYIGKMKSYLSNLESHKGIDLSNLSNLFLNSTFVRYPTAKEAGSAEKTTEPETEVLIT